MGEHRHGIGLGVSIHAPVRGATCGGLAQMYNLGVSIHAPVRGATQHKYRIIEALKVSIHAPVRGATKAGMFARQTGKFQSTRP